MPAPFTVRPTQALEEYGHAIYGIGQYFGAAPTEDRLERFAKVLPFDRMHAAFEGETIVGGAGAFPFELTVPGGVVPAAGVTVVGTFPTHRRSRRATACATARSARAWSPPWRRAAS